MPKCLLALWVGPQLLLAKVKDANRQDWYIYFLSFSRAEKNPANSDTVVALERETRKIFLIVTSNLSGRDFPKML